jgi:hypothetical protein
MHIQAQLMKDHFSKLTNLTEFLMCKIMKHITFYVQGSNWIIMCFELLGYNLMH